jgi:hypothetical protein
MHVVSACPLPVASLLWQPQPAMWVLTVVCKATFTLLPGESALASDQDEPAEDDDHWNDDTARSLRVASDLVPMKPQADVTLVGHAFAPGGAPVRSLVVRLVVGEIDKGFEVVCDRYFDQEGTLHEGPRFTRMPLVYERAGGGPGTSNPVGVQGAANSYGRIPVPNLQPVNTRIASASDYVAPVGFGPVSPGWPARREKLGRGAPLGAAPDVRRQPLPDDLQPAYFNHAPRDQQVQLLRDRERIVLENLHPDHPRFVTSLPSLRPRATVERPGAPRHVPLRCDTLWIDTDRGVCTLAWRAQVPLKHPDEEGRVVVALETPGQAASRADSELGKLQLRGPDSTTDTLVPTRRPAQTQGENVLPFARSATGSLPAARDARLHPLDLPPEKNVLPFTPAPAQPRSDDMGGVANTGGLPFFGGTASTPPPRPHAEPFHIPPPPSPRTGSSTTDTQPPHVVPQMAPPGPITSALAPLPPAAAPPPRASLWSIPEPVALPMTVGQLAAAPAGVIDAPPDPLLMKPSPAQFSVGQQATASTPPQPAPVVQGSGKAGSAAALSTAAAATPATAPAPASAPAAAPAGAKAPAEAAQKGEPKKALQLVWFDTEYLPRIRRKPAFQTLLAALEDRPVDADLDDPATARDPVAVEDRRDVFEVLARGEAVDEAGLDAAVERAVRDDGKYVAPFLLIGGEVRFTFDELTTLKVALSIASPFATGDDGLKSASADAREFLRLSDTMTPSGMAEGFTTRIQEAFRKARRSVSATYLDEQLERALLERRSYLKREVFGAPHLRALLLVGAGTRPWPIYLPDAAARRLPMFTRFAVRLLGEACLQEDQYEGHPTAIRVAALGRVAALVPRAERPAAKP